MCDHLIESWLRLIFHLIALKYREQSTFFFHFEVYASIYCTLFLQLCFSLLSSFLQRLILLKYLLYLVSPFLFLSTRCLVTIRKRSVLLDNLGLILRHIHWEHWEWRWLYSTSHGHSWSLIRPLNHFSFFHGRIKLQTLRLFLVCSFHLGIRLFWRAVASTQQRLVLLIAWAWATKHTTTYYFLTFDILSFRSDTPTHLNRVLHQLSSGFLLLFYDPDHCCLFR